MRRLVHLVRHGSHAHVGKILTGRMPGVGLTDLGRDEAEGAARVLARDGVDSILTSPRERALETATILSERLGAPRRVSSELDEIDFGAWSGQPFVTLDEREDWQAWNASRSAARTPAGASMAEARDRVITLMGALESARTALVSHADVIKAALLHCLGMSFDGWRRIDVAPASVSTVAFEAWGPTVIRMNETGR